jgi:hypothetical protein
MPLDTLALDLAASILQIFNLTFQLVEIGYIGLILPNSTSWHVIFAKLKPLENTKMSICYSIVCTLTLYNVIYA